MKTLVEQLRTLCGNCILAPQNRNAERLKPYCDACEMKWRAADEIDRLQAELDAKTTTLAYLQKNEDAAANVARQAALNAIRECQRVREERDRLQKIVDQLPMLIALAGYDAIVNFQRHGHEMSEQDCLPSLYKRGNEWRYHRRVAGNEWADDEDLLQAAQKARVEP